MGKLRVGGVYRTARPYASSPEQIDGLPNFFARVATPGKTLPTLERGINAPRSVDARDGSRRPVILISSSPHKVGSDWTPWQDSIEPDVGFVRYYGDNKTAGVDPAASPGNALLLDEFSRHTSPDEGMRRRATPITVFRRVDVDGRKKGNVEFAGLAVIERASRVTQYSAKAQVYFTNYAFELAILGLKDQNEELDWDWISARRNPALTEAQALTLSPSSWKTWIREGHPALPRLRRHVSRAAVVSASDQRPASGTRLATILASVYRFYHGRKARFEGLASAVAAQVLTRSGAVYREGWVTPASADHGTDFVGRLTIGDGFSKTRIVVLGQAKCERLDSPTGGVHVARTVARLRRGWIGVYVTTSYFSDAVQREVLEDQYPILLIHGLEVARTVEQLMIEAGYSDPVEYLKLIDQGYDRAVSHRRPEEILYD